MDSIEGTVRAYFDALNRSDVEGVVGVVAEDGAWRRDESDTVMGHQQIRAVFEGMFQAMRLQPELHADHLREGGDLAAALTHTTGTVTMVANGITISALSRELFVLSRSAGDWYVTDCMFNQAVSSGC